MNDTHSSPLSTPDADSDWYDPKESTHDLEHPKYYDAEALEVIVGIEQRKAPMKLDTLCGTYRWFYEFPEPGVSEPGEIVYPANVPAQESPGFLTITCPGGKKPTLKNITGTVRLFGKEARFSGIKRAKDRDNKNLVDNHWEFVSFKWKENYGAECLDDGNSILALEISDDGGSPFVMFRYASPPPKSGHTWYLDVAAKKERPGQKQKGYALSTTEMTRLGMRAEYPEVRARALAAASREESEESSSSDEDDVAEKHRPTGKRKPDSDELDVVRPKKRKPA
ncbi:hypothetical protein K438DRAFT_1805437 [Mycena galopus ATCC 62051]|nr:hypothetical protein K438DRAFT_1805437 [Mycena galopus ATCC 62051]